MAAAPTQKPSPVTQITGRPSIVPGQILLADDGELDARKAAQATAFTSTRPGIAPASGGGTTNFLRADATWAEPPGGGVAGPPAIPTVAKTIDASNNVRFTITQAVQSEDEETYLCELYEPTGSYVVWKRTLTSVSSGSSRIRDQWIDFTAAEMTTAGYTPSGTETYWVDVTQIGDTENSANYLQEL